MPEIDYLAAGERFAREALAPMLRPEAMARVAWHKARSYKAAIVSGAHDVYLSRWCRTHDIEPICSTLEVQDGVFTGRYGGAQCVRERKPRRVRERYATDSFDAVYACGDTPEDFALLEAQAALDSSPTVAADDGVKLSDANRGSRMLSFGRLLEAAAR